MKVSFRLQVLILVLAIAIILLQAQLIKNLPSRSIPISNIDIYDMQVAFALAQSKFCYFEQREQANEYFDHALDISLANEIELQVEDSRYQCPRYAVYMERQRRSIKSP